MRIVNHIAFGIVSLLGVALLVGCSEGPIGVGGTGAGGNGGNAKSWRVKGAREAAESVKAGKLLLKEYPPLPSPPWHGEYVSLIRERLGVEYEVPTKPDGVAEADFIEEVRGWNETMQAEIDRKFGAGTLGKLHQEADQRWRDRIKPGGKQ